jgi:two-component sensor histidine kinase
MMQSGPFARPTLNQSFLLLLMFMISTAVPSLALSADIQARKRAQKHQALLLKELSHRVGNTLAVLNSVFRRSARHARSVAELEEGFQGRLMSLAQAHRLLGESDWESASVGDLARTTVGPYCPPDYDGCEYNGDALRIPGSIATALSMVLHELATNAAKHGALRSGGKLKIGWSRERDSSGEDVLRIDWEESLSPAPPSHKGPGYGTTLIDTTIGTLGGHIERVHVDDAFTVRITIPISR